MATTNLPDYKADFNLCRDFLLEFSRHGKTPTYMPMLQEIANRTRRTIDIDVSDLEDFEKDNTLADRVSSNTRRYVTIFSQAIDAIMPSPSPDAPTPVDDVYDVLMKTRLNEHQDTPDNKESAHNLPPEIRRRYELRLVPSEMHQAKAHSLRSVRASQLGHLVTVRGIVTRITDVKPLLQVATYTCDNCGFEIYQEVTSRTFTPLAECPSQRCITNNAKGQLILQSRGSKFLKFQEGRIQEMAEQVPKGHIPRSMSIHFRGELTRTVGPGDVVSVSGIFLPMPYTGFRAMRAGLTADTFLEAMSVMHLKKRFGKDDVPDDIQEQLKQMAEEGDIYPRLARSIAPEIYGHEDVKKALLLLLVGAPSRHLKDGMKMRGDIHVCLMGDPGVAKSQLLKHMCGVAPRGVYTTGKGSSGVGLTAAVHRDPVTSEMVLEGGALVLADMGICAIDEFDKMEESDRTSIHEVMEQQTVSIAKAGITTSLNARTAVLAAANPAWGRYDMRRTPAENINLPPSLLSRFDLLWLILDRADLDSDLALARHVLYVHQHLDAPLLDFDPIDSTTLRSYVSMARNYTPNVPRDLTEYLASAYAAMRQEEAESDAPHTYTTARTLLSILRLAEAVARLRFSTLVVQSDVDEALRLLQMSKFSLYSEANKASGVDPISDVYAIIRDEAARSHSLDVSYTNALSWITAKGRTEEQLKECLEEYASLNVWQVDPVSFDIRFLDV